MVETSTAGNLSCISVCGRERERERECVCVCVHVCVCVCVCVCAHARMRAFIIMCTLRLCCVVCVACGLVSVEG